MASTACIRRPPASPVEALRVLKSSPVLSDDLPLEPLIDAIKTQITVIEAKQDHPGFTFAARSYSRHEYLAGLRRFVELSESISDRDMLMQQLAKEFVFYEVYGDTSWGQVNMTSYFEPVIPGSLKPSKHFSRALYRQPEDLMALDLTLFSEKFRDERKMRARLQGRRLVPYYSREEIDSGHALAGRTLEICWVDPIDAFFLQVQGSGTIALKNGQQLRLNYADKNGHEYFAIGKLLRDIMPLEKINLHSLETYLRALSEAQMQSTLNKNPSYVFFKESTKNALTYLGVPATAGRTIATDKRFFPKGALAFLVFDKPVFNDQDVLEYHSERVGRFVLDQDVGGAITGTSRVDLFWGRGADAKRHAGVLKGQGRLYYLAPRRDKSPNNIVE